MLLEIPAGESLQEHQVHEHAWVTVLSGQVEVTSAEQTVSGGTGLMFSFAPSERHAVHAREDTRLLLILTPWPGDGHPGAMSLADKRTVRSRAAEHRLAH
ncbi:MAG: cupin domain-containing protein [Solirubrobacterales bacterium]|nr:cupin domain-containing protein [Solirubrobacterales bacterium]